MRVLAKGTPRFVVALWSRHRREEHLGPRPTALLAAGCTWFFRDPERTPDGEGSLAAADGVVQWVRTDDQGSETISTYLNLLDVHVTRAPCDATVDRTELPPRPAPSRHSAARARERANGVGARDRARQLRLTQFAGTVARRIVAHKSTATCCGEVSRSA